MRYITPEIVMQARFRTHARPQWDLAVLCFRDLRGSSALVQALGALPVGYKVLWGLEESTDYPFTYEARIGKSRVGIITRCVWGGPQAAILVEELASLGVKQLIGYGAAGSLVPELPKGAQIVATSGLVTDGTSRVYAQFPELPGSPALCSPLQDVGQALAINIIPVKIAAVDAVYRETESAVSTWVTLGAHAVNMETTPFYAVSSACGVESVWMGYVSDSLMVRVWDPWADTELLSRDTARVAVSLLQRLCA